MNLRHSCDSPQVTEQLGCRLAKGLLNENRFPAVILLCGALGAGKTVFCQGVAQGMGIDEPVQSPTFPILLEYNSRVPLYHFDLYRLAGSEEFDLIGGEDILFHGGSYGLGLSLIEWPERLGWLEAMLQDNRPPFKISPKNSRTELKPLCLRVDLRFHFHLHLDTYCQKRDIYISQL